MFSQSHIGQVEVEIASGKHGLKATLSPPGAVPGLVIFAHGSGSSRFSSRNRFVASCLQEAGMGTLLLDLLEASEEQDRKKVFDVRLLARRLQDAADWVRQQPDCRNWRLGFFGASTGAAAALIAAAGYPENVAAVDSRGGRPDLAADCLHQVRSPTLLIVGGNDDVVIDLNEQALALLNCPKEMVIIPGATHLFPEPGALEEVARLATEWFLRYLAPSS